MRVSATMKTKTATKTAGATPFAMPRNNRRFIVGRFLSKLSADERAYAASPDRGESRGFAAVHDFTDANELLLEAGCPAPDGTQARLDDINTVITAITAALIAA